MKTRSFFNLDQAIQYLNNNIIRVANHPILITRVDSGNRNKGNFKLTYMKVEDRTGKEYSILSDAEEVDMNPLPMGMLSIRPGNAHTSKAQYLERIPLRRMEVGASRNNVLVNDVMTGVRGIGNGCMYSSEFVDTVKGRFLSLPEALEASAKKGCYPFSRRFAVNDKREVYYKGTYGTPVGKVDGGVVVLNDEAFFLREVLREDLNG